MNANCHTIEAGSKAFHKISIVWIRDIATSSATFSERTMTKLFRLLLLATLAANSTPITGAPRIAYTFTLGSDVSEQVAFEKDRMFAATGNGYLFAIDTVTKKLLWKIKSSLPEAKPNGEPLVVGDKLFLSGYTSLAAYDLRSGNEASHTNMSHSVVQAHLVAQSGTVVATVAYTVRAFQAATGKELWQTRVNEPGSMGIYKSWVLLVRPFKLAAYDLKTGKEEWAVALDGADGDSRSLKPVLVGSQLYFIVNMEIFRVNLAARAVTLRVKSSEIGARGGDFNSIAVNDGVLATSTREALLLLDAKTGKRIAMAPVEGSQSPTAAFVPQFENDGIIYGVFLAESLVQIDRKTAAKTATLPIGGWPNAVVKHGRYLYVSTTSGVVAVEP